jgi:hypothetical protein
MDQRREGEKRMTPTPETRKFALKLHSLHDDDRTWILNQLDDVTHQEFKNLLRELEEIGLEPGSSLCLNEKETKSQAKYAHVPVHPYASGRFESILATARPSTIQHILKDEPAVLSNICIQLYPWPWLNNKLVQTSSTGRSAITQSSGKHTQKVKEVLIRALANRIQLAPDYVSGELTAPSLRKHNTTDNYTFLKRIAKKIGILRGRLPWQR